MQAAGKLMKVFLTRRIPPEGMKILSAAGVYAAPLTVKLHFIRYHEGSRNSSRLCVCPQQCSLIVFTFQFDSVFKTDVWLGFLSLSDTPSFGPSP